MHADEINKRTVANTWGRSMRLLLFACLFIYLFLLFVSLVCLCLSFFVC